MVEIPFVTVELLFAAAWLLWRAAVCVRRGSVDWKREGILLLMYVNLAVIIRFAFFPMDRVNGRVQPLLFDPAAVFPFRVNLVPFVNLFDYETKRKLLLNVVGNVGMYIPSGIVLPVVCKKPDGFGKTVLTGALISLCFEMLQLPFNVRTSDIDDLILNTLGVAVGYGIYFACAGRRRVRGGKIHD